MRFKDPILLKFLILPTPLDIFLSPSPPGPASRILPPCKSIAIMTVQDKDVRAELEREEQLDLVDPLRHFLAIDDDSSTPTASSSTDIRDIPSENDYSIVPQQIESIINKLATIRYYKDITKRPELLQAEATQLKDANEENKEHWDVHLKLDMTTGCGGKIWPAAEVLGAYIAAKYSHPRTIPSEQQPIQQEANKGYNNHNFDWRKKSIVELGSGTGLVGFLVHALNLSGCKVYVTDQQAMLPLMRENLVLNFPASTSDANTATNPHTSGFTTVAELDWGTTLASTFTNPLPDVLLLADCVYLEVAFQPLVDTMAALSTDQTEILFCYQKRRKADKRFFALLKKHFFFEDVADDDPQRTIEYRRQGTQLLRVRKKP